jgi:hypothetical protein
MPLKYSLKLYHLSLNFTENIHIISCSLLKLTIAFTLNDIFLIPVLIFIHMG